MSYTDPQTAMGEMRPWVGESLSAALFEVQQDVPVVLCQSQNEDPLGRVSLDNKKLAPETVESCVWSDISTAFARPVNRDDLERDYVPTQILAETFKGRRLWRYSVQKPFGNGIERGSV
jgi:hypothetical protein